MSFKLGSIKFLKNKKNVRRVKEFLFLGLLSGILVKIVIMGLGESGQSKFTPKATNFLVARYSIVDGTPFRWTDYELRESRGQESSKAIFVTDDEISDYENHTVTCGLVEGQNLERRCLERGAVALGIEKKLPRGKRGYSVLGADFPHCNSGQYVDVFTKSKLQPDATEKILEKVLVVSCSSPVTLALGDGEIEVIESAKSRGGLTFVSRRNDELIENATVRQKPMKNKVKIQSIEVIHVS